VQAEAFGAALPGLAVGQDHLVVGDTVLGLDRVADDDVAGAARAGVVAEADQFREVWHLVNQRDVVEVEDAAAFGGGRLELGQTGVVRGEHDLLAVPPGLVAQDQFGNRAAVEAEAHQLHQGEDARVRQGLDGIVFAKAVNAGKGLLERRAGGKDAGFVVDMEGGAVVRCYLPDAGKRRCLKSADMGMVRAPGEKVLNAVFFGKF